MYSFETVSLDQLDDLAKTGLHIGRGRFEFISNPIVEHRRGSRVVVVRVFVKKTQKTPRREIEVALQRAQDVQDR